MATQFQAAEPIVVPASEGKTYDKYWLLGFNVRAESPDKPIRLMARFVPCRDTDSGVKELQPNAKEIVMTVEDVNATAAQDAEFASVMESVLAKMQKMGVERGLFSASV